MEKAAQLLLGIVIVVSAVQTHAQVYKCKGPNGSVEIQQSPCMGAGEKLNVRPASGHDVAPSANAATPGEASKSAQTLKNKYAQQAEDLKDERLRREGWHQMNRTKNRLTDSIAQCQAEQRDIESEKTKSNNNLAGATRDVSISSKMQAASAICDSNIRRLEKEVDTAVAQCERIKCIAAN